MRLFRSDDKYHNMFSIRFCTGSAFFTLNNNTGHVFDPFLIQLNKKSYTMLSLSISGITLSNISGNINKFSAISLKSGTSNGVIGLLTNEKYIAFVQFDMACFIDHMYRLAFALIDQFYEVVTMIRICAKSRVHPRSDLFAGFKKFPVVHHIRVFITENARSRSPNEESLFFICYLVQ